jgi:hypothetical protein
LIDAIVIEATWFEIHVGNDTVLDGNNSIFITDALKCEMPLKDLKLSVVTVLSEAPKRPLLIFCRDDKKDLNAN